MICCFLFPASTLPPEFTMERHIRRVPSLQTTPSMAILRQVGTDRDYCSITTICLRLESIGSMYHDHRRWRKVKGRPLRGAFCNKARRRITVMLLFPHSQIGSFRINILTDGLEMARRGITLKVGVRLNIHRHGQDPRMQSHLPRYLRSQSLLASRDLSVAFLGLLNILNPRI